MYADYEYYSGEFAGTLIPSEAFNRWAKLASLEIDQATHGAAAKLETVPDAVKDCVCAIAEVLYMAEEQAQKNITQGLSGPLASWSNDGQSGSVDLGQSIYTETGKRKEIARLCRLYLGMLGLLYAGVRHYES